MPPDMVRQMTSQKPNNVAIFLIKLTSTTATKKIAVDPTVTIAGSLFAVKAVQEHISTHWVAHRLVEDDNHTQWFRCSDTIITPEISPPPAAYAAVFAERCVHP